MRADTSEVSLREALGVGDRDEGNYPAEEAPLLLYPFPEAEYLEVCPAIPLPTRATVKGNIQTFLLIGSDPHLRTSVLYYSIPGTCHSAQEPTARTIVS